MTSRYGGPGAVVASVAVFGVIFCLAGYTIISAASLTSDACFGPAGQATCPVAGPDWSRAVPGALAFLGMLTGFVGLFAGRPIRTPAMAAGVLLTAAALLTGWFLTPS